eukprot:7150583-Prymnesium_polylepis.2
MYVHFRGAHRLTDVRWPRASRGCMRASHPVTARGVGLVLGPIAAGGPYHLGPSLARCSGHEFRASRNVCASSAAQVHTNRGAGAHTAPKAT